MSTEDEKARRAAELRKLIEEGHGAPASGPRTPREVTDEAARKASREPRTEPTPEKP